MKNFRTLAFAAVLLLAPIEAFAQSSPGWDNRTVPTPAQWNAAFASKQDRLGFIPLNTAGGVLTGKLSTAPSTSTQAGFNIGPGTAPGTPVNGDMWITASGLFARVNGATVGPYVSSSTSSITVGSSSVNSATNNYLLASAGGILAQVAPTITVNGTLCTVGSSCAPIATAGSVTAGTTAVSGVADGNLLNNTGGTLGSVGSTGTGNVVRATNAHLVTPDLGVPSAIDLSNGLSLPISGVSGWGSSVPAWLGLPSSANLLAAMTDETGTGVLVFNTDPTFKKGGFNINFPTPTANDQVALLGKAGQVVSGGASVTSLPLSTTNSLNVDCSLRPQQYITGNTTSWVINAPTVDGSCILLLQNAASSAVIPVFSGFSVSSAASLQLNTTANNRFMIWIGRVNGISTFTVTPLQ